MTDQDTIPADKVREILKKLVDDGRGCPEQTLGAVEDSLRALLPTPQPTTGLLGRWAKHPDYGDVMCVWDKPKDGWINIYKRANNGVTGAEWYQIRFSDLTFPEQATRPEEVPAGEAWLVNLNGGKHTRVVALKASHDTWRIGRSDSIVTLWRDEFVELIAPLVPERPASDLQAKYDDLVKRWNHLDDLYSARGSFIDELNAKYREAQERIKTLEQASTPRTVTTPEEYDALPVGSAVSTPGNEVWQKGNEGLWSRAFISDRNTNAGMSGTIRTVLRYGWGTIPSAKPKPVWRIEHDHTNLRVGEYIIDADGDTGTINRAVRGNAVWCVGMASTSRECGPWIAFVNKEAATPEAIAEAKRARDKEMEE